MEERLSRESGADAWNAVTFGDQPGRGWTFEAAVKANDRLGASAGVHAEANHTPDVKPRSFSPTDASTDHASSSSSTDSSSGGGDGSACRYFDLAVDDQDDAVELDCGKLSPQVFDLTLEDAEDAVEEPEEDPWSAW
jgi:hypothetical protein